MVIGGFVDWLIVIGSIVNGWIVNIWLAFWH